MEKFTETINTTFKNNLVKKKIRITYQKYTIDCLFIQTRFNKSEDNTNKT